MAISRQRAGVFATSKEVQKATGFRSGLEVVVTGSLESQGCQFLYEPVRLTFNDPRVYIPDYALTSQCIILEAKGEFKTEDRRKMLLVKKQYPDLDIRIVFSNSKNRLGKKSKTTYAMWCEKNGFPCADKAVPPEWVAHNPTQKQKEAFATILGIKLNG